MTIWFDMDGTLANLYGVIGWLEAILNEDVRPYKEAAVLHNMSVLARLLNRAQAKGYKLGIISWTAKNGTPQYNEAVAISKCNWLKQHLTSVKWDIIKIVPYGTPKGETCKEGILFDDEEPNRKAWCNTRAYEPKDIMKVLQIL